MGEMSWLETALDELDDCDGVINKGGILRGAHAELEAMKARIAALEKALTPFAKFAEKWDFTPMRGVADALYSIHGGEGGSNGKGADLRLSDCRNARKALLGE